MLGSVLILMINSFRFAQFLSFITLQLINFFLSISFDIILAKLQLRVISDLQENLLF